MSIRRRIQEEPHDSHDRWLVSYADFITLLFAFFVVMYGLSSINQNKYRDLTSSLGNAFGRQSSALNRLNNGENHTNYQKYKTLNMPSLPLTKQINERLRKERESMTGIAINLAKTMAPLVKNGQLRVIQNNQGIRIDISDSVLFEPGSAELSPTSEMLLKTIALALSTDTHALQIEGHTDNIPIHNASFYSNWELSAVRASSLVRMMALNGIEESRLSAVGFGASRPLAENETPQGRAKNRRVSMTLLYGHASNLDGAEVTSH